MNAFLFSLLSVCVLGKKQHYLKKRPEFASECDFPVKMKNT